MVLPAPLILASIVMCACCNVYVVFADDSDDADNDDLPDLE